MEVVRPVTVTIVGRSAGPLYGSLVAGPWTVRFLSLFYRAIHRTTGVGGHGDDGRS